MNKAIRLTLIAVIMIGSIVGATWIKSINKPTQERVIIGIMEDCLKKEESINKQILAANYCRTDQECRAVDLRCPWGGEDRCRYVLVNKNHSVALIQDDAMWFQTCLAKSEEIKNKYPYCEGGGKDRTGCPELATMKLKCVDRKCVPAE